MTIEQTLTENMKKAMKAKDKATLTTVRMILANIKNQKIEKRADLTDEEVLAVIRTDIKQCKETIEEGYGKDPEKYAEKISEINNRIIALESYLPTQLTLEELESIIKATILEVGATKKSEMGKVMAALMPKVKGLAEGKTVNQTVGSILI